MDRLHLPRWLVARTAGVTRRGLLFQLTGLAAAVSSLLGAAPADARERGLRPAGRPTAARRPGVAGNPRGKKKRKPCRNGKKRCGDRCVNVQTDARHCGKCNRACPGPIRCRAGVCSPQFVRAWGQFGTGIGQFQYPTGIAATPNGTLIVADSSNHRLKHFDRDGRPLEAWGVPGPQPGSDPTTTLSNPRSVAVTTKLPAGLATARGWAVYVSDHAHHRVKLVDLDNPAWIRQYGDTASDAPGSFNFPEGLAVAPNGRFYVADLQNHRIQSWSKNGTGDDLITWGRRGDEPGEFTFPHAVAVGPDGEVYVLDSFNRRVQVFSADGRFRREWGSQGDAPGQFDEPYGIAVTRDRRVWVVDAARDLIQVFDHNGRFLLSWGEFGNGEGQFNFPRALAVTDEGIFVADSGNHRIQQFR